MSPEKREERAEKFAKFLEKDRGLKVDLEGTRLQVTGFESEVQKKEVENIAEDTKGTTIKQNQLGITIQF